MVEYSQEIYGIPTCAYFKFTNDSESCCSHKSDLPAPGEYLIKMSEAITEFPTGICCYT